MNHFRNREMHHAGPKPGFEGEVFDRTDKGQRWARMQEMMQARYAEDGLPEDTEPGQRVR